MSRSMTQVGPTKGSPPWTNDFLNREHLVPGGAKLDAAQFLATDAVVVMVGAAGAAGGATSVPVDALSGAIPSGVTLHFGTNKYATLSAAAAAGATSLTTLAIPTALVDNDTATYAGAAARSVRSGTVIGRTLAERDASTGYGPAAAADDEVFVVAFDIDDVLDTGDVELVRHNTVLKENFLPNWTTLASAVKALVRANYVCMRGAD